jgi:ABC-2 type transport system permease protein
VNLALEQAEAGKLTYAQIAPIVEAYMASAPQDDPTAALLDVRTPAPEQPKNLLLHIVSPIMGGMMIFYAFFTGANTAGTILREDEEGTLARLFTTPTTQAQILAGKLLAVGLTILVQIIVLVTASRLLFGIAWGNLGALALFTIGTVFVAGTFGLFLNSLLKNSKQGGILYGGALTVTGMVGMMDIFTGNAGASQLGIVPLFTPQGWAARSMLQIMMKGATPIEILPWAAAMLLWSAVFFTVGVWRFQKRYA